MLNDCFPHAACRLTNCSVTSLSRPRTVTQTGVGEWKRSVSSVGGGGGVNRVFSVQFTCHFSDPADRSPIFTAEL